jgi:hypothetical protein
VPIIDLDQTASETSRAQIDNYPGPPIPGQQVLDSNPIHETLNKKEKTSTTMNTFEFQFGWGGTRSAFGLDVNASTIEEAVTKANRFLNSDATGSPVNHPDAERLWMNVVGPVIPRNIASTYGPLGNPQCRDYTVGQWRKAYEVQRSVCHLPCLGESAHLHQNRWICQERCRDDRLKASE